MLTGLICVHGDVASLPPSPIYKWRLQWTHKRCSNILNKDEGAYRLDFHNKLITTKCL